MATRGRQAKTQRPFIVFTPRQVGLLVEILTNHCMSIGDAINDPEQADMRKDLRAEYAELEDLLKAINSLRFVQAVVV